MVEIKSSVDAYFLFAIGTAILSFILMNKTANGRKFFFILFGILLVSNLSHFFYIKSLPPPTTKYGGFDRAFGYFLALIAEVVVLLITALIWRISYQLKKKKTTRSDESLSS